MVGLGLENGAIRDSQIRSSLSESNPSSGRLHHPSSSWCFLYSQVQKDGKEAYLEVDLERETLVSGFQTQGPPESLHGANYMRYISLRVLLSLDGVTWEDCCSSDGGKTHFYADDKNNEVNKVRTHGFGRLVVARFMRILVSTDLRWIGHDEKCFRLEVLGCEEGMMPASNMTATAMAPGYISVQWQPPVVAIPGDNSYPLDGRYFLLTSQHSEDNRDMVQSYNTSDTSLVLPSPMWGSLYHLHLTCTHAGQQLPCGSVRLVARPESSLACQSHSSFCREEELVVFVSPAKLAAHSLANGSVLVRWTDCPSGWRSPRRLVRVETEAGSIVLEEETQPGQSTVIVSGLSITDNYQLVFYPSGDGIPDNVGEVSASLALLASEQGGPQHRAFIAAIGLKAHVVWTGSIRVMWNVAKASALDEKGKMFDSLIADHYKIILSIGEGKN